MTEQISLYFRQGSSDKIYQAAIEPEGGGYVVTFAYGRRGSTLATGTKTNAPVPYEDAKRIYENLVAEKTAKGYTPGESGTPYQRTEREAQFSGITPQLLNPIDAEEAVRLTTDPAWCAQEKFFLQDTCVQSSGNRRHDGSDAPSSWRRRHAPVEMPFAGSRRRQSDRLYHLFKLNRQRTFPRSV